ncbi:MAG: hypothetical protein PPP55_07635 [Halorubrum sp.]
MCNDESSGGETSDHGTGTQSDRGTNESKGGAAAGEPHPIDGTALVKAAALASVPSDRLPTLLVRVQSDLAPRINEYRHRYERVGCESDREAFLVVSDHWETIGARLDLSRREQDAVVRAHEAAIERWGSTTGRREEFETALEIRSAVVIGVPASE